MSTKSSSSSSSTFVGNDSSQFDVITPIKPPLIGFITPLSNVYNNAAAASKSCQKQQSNVEQTVMCGNSDSSEINIDQLTKSFTSILIVDKEMYNCKHKDQEFGSCVICLSPFKSPSNFKTTKCKHTFHQSCLDEAKWRSSSCPLCRSILTPHPTSKCPPTSEFSNPIVSAANRGRNAVRLAIAHRQSS